MDNYSRSNSFTQGVKDGIPLLLAIAPYALVLGAQASKAGLTTPELGLMTVLNFAGGSEFAAIQLWQEPLPVLTIILLTFLINSRHIIMGAALTPYLKHLPRRKVLPALFLMADEGWAVAYSKTLKNAAIMPADKSLSMPYFLGACFPFYPVWVGFSVLGCLVGPILGNVEEYGFAMAFPATFIVLLRGMWKGYRAARPWLVSLAVAAAVYLVIPGHAYVLAGTFSGLLAAWFWGDKNQ
ncbi:AzlC family ABC transporter permease [Serratia plymuthica]|uniref:AzlC family ABC transporter permease n=1 Tax=Serratia plymuthica TaxID=82996 RepID=A0A2X4UN46_SERPL|nr:AzlC family ABC transporter permease [Serratia plymuthica]QPS20851.1 AzlC family ABC transporter permease [Serratia plymuthica]QPS62463.1 AzlC family ABC transporter permease [Serratia plymuthica]RKS65239.1 4-azaleucine resistance transporter AzlC [Serratia plymuthica]CAI2432973.1 Inner membrane protein YgaZ [Serratia plymuthica]SQI39979.1 Inner membrane protein YgaZ [Serratia plymuthica]